MGKFKGRIKKTNKSGFWGVFLKCTCIRPQNKHLKKTKHLMNDSKLLP